jgi:hypothetical protein
METAAVDIAALDSDPAEAVVVTRGQVHSVKPIPTCSRKRPAGSASHAVTRLE